MATYRQVHIKYWQDPFIEELEPLQRYFYLYLMTNSKTTQCGCYEISYKLIKYETGLSQNQVDNFIDLLEKNNKIKFNKETNEFLLINWLKHNSFASPKVKACINKELKNIKNQVFIDFINSIVNENIPMDSLLIDYTKCIDTETQKEEEEEEEKEEEKEEEEKEKEEIYMQHFHLILTKSEYEDLLTVYKKRCVDEMIETVRTYSKEYLKKYSNFKAVIHNWIKKIPDSKLPTEKELFRRYGGDV